MIKHNVWEVSSGEKENAQNRELTISLETGLKINIKNSPESWIMSSNELEVEHVRLGTSNEKEAQELALGYIERFLKIRVGADKNHLKIIKDITG